MANDDTSNDHHLLNGIGNSLDVGADKHPPVLDLPPNSVGDNDHRSSGSPTSTEPAETASGPHLDAIRGGETPGVPSVTVQDGDGPSRLLRHASDAGTERAERLTISDRGDSLYEEASRQGSTRPPPGVFPPVVHEGQSLMERLMVLRCRSSPPEGHLFFPRGLVEGLITTEVVVEALKDRKGELEFMRPEPISDAEIEKIAEDVCSSSRSYRKMFAILILLEREWEIVSFIKDDLCDSDLPLSAVPVGGQGLLVKLRRKSDLTTDLSCLRRWGPKVHENFDKEQWAMVAPFFARAKSNRAGFYELSSKDILPWVEVNSSLHQGGYSSISRVIIHPSHHNFEKSEMSDGSFAIKHFTPNRAVESTVGSTAGMSDSSTQLSGPDEHPMQSAVPISPQELKKEFEREIETLNRFSGDNYPHLISLLAAYRHGDDYCLIFRWATSDLKALWKNRSPGPALDRVNLHWMLSQCRGIASGLQKIHFYQTTETRTRENRDDNPPIFGRHGDIKPENILLFQNQRKPGDQGTLVITDFGLVKFHRDGTKTYFSARDVPATLTYQPPECDMIGTRISRSFDIWSFGCVLLEFITWYLGGWDHVLKFVSKRKSHNPLVFGWKTDHFYEIVRQPDGKVDGPVFARVKPEIFEFVAQLHGHPQCCDILHELLDFIMADMLLVESDGPAVRAQCHMVYSVLNRFCTSLESPDYEVQATPRPITMPDVPVAVEMLLSQEGKKLLNASRFYDLREHTGRTRSRSNTPGFQDQVGSSGPRRTQTVPTQPTQSRNTQNGTTSFHG